MRRWSALAGVLAIAMACTGDRSRSADRSLDLRGAGATFPFPLYRAWFSEYGAKAGVRINYYSVGSAEGLRLLDRGEADFGAIDSPEFPLSPSAATTCMRRAIPTVTGAIAVAYNLPTLPANRALKLDARTIASIYAGRIRMWDAPELVALNRTFQLPHAAIVVVHRAPGSGTSRAFADYLRTSGVWNPQRSPAGDVMWPIGVSTEGNEGIASEVKVTAGAIGYAELAYARENRLSVAAIRDQRGEFRLPGGSEDKYPITTRTWLVFDPERLSAEKGEALTAFIRWALQDGAAIAHDYEYHALEPDTVARYDSLLTRTDFKSCARAHPPKATGE